MSKYKLTCGCNEVVSASTPRTNKWIQERPTDKGSFGAYEHLSILTCKLECELNEVTRELIAARKQMTDKLFTLERERNMWKAAHDNQVKLKKTLTERPDLKERAKLIGDLITERDNLQEWKNRQLEVESEWDIQEVGNAIGLHLGQSIRPHILSALKKLQKELEEGKRDALETYL